MTIQQRLFLKLIPTMTDAQVFETLGTCDKVLGDLEPEYGFWSEQFLRECVRACEQRLRVVNA